MFNTQNQLSQQEAYERLSKDKSIPLVDVRSVEEFVEDGHVEGSINLPLDDLVEMFPQTFKDKEATIYVICYSGARAASAVNYLRREGYKNVFNVGGVMTWPSELVD